jgi:hypothetical protein
MIRLLAEAETFPYILGGPLSLCPVTADQLHNDHAAGPPASAIVRFRRRRRGFRRSFLNRSIRRVAFAPALPGGEQLLNGLDLTTGLVKLSASGLLVKVSKEGVKEGSHLVPPA